jgi:hypothetical protein
MRGLFREMLAYLRVRFPRDLPGELVSNDYFRVLGIRPRYGRDFDSDEIEPVAVISERMGGREMVGSALDIQGHRFTIIGIVPAEYRGIVLDWGDRPQVWIPMQFYRKAVDFGQMDALHAREMRSFVVTGRLAPGVTVERAAREIGALAERSRAQNEDRVASAVPLAQARFWPGFRSQILRVLTILFLVGASVLAIACANVGALMLTRAAERHRDIAVRLSLGSRVRDVAGLLLTESFIPSAAGCIGGVLLGAVLTRALAAFPKLFSIPLALDLSLDVRVLGFTAAMGIVVCVVVGLLPLHQALRTDLIASFERLARRAASGQFGICGQGLLGCRSRSHWRCWWKRVCLSARFKRPARWTRFCNPATCCCAALKCPLDWTGCSAGSTNFPACVKRRWPRIYR